MTSITETGNELTGDMDIASPRGLLRLLRQSDNQLFSGYKDYASLSDTETMATMSGVIEACVAAFTRIQKDKDTNGKDKPGRVKIIFSGAGTSGRIAFFVAKAFNNYFPSESYFHYLIAGGDKALIVGQEGSEDDVKAAVVDMKAVIGEETETVVYVGITCGFSAPYVAAQLDYLFSLADEGKTQVVSVLMGFNPVELARKNVIEHWHRSFYDIAEEMQKRANILNY